MCDYKKGDILESRFNGKIVCNVHTKWTVIDCKKQYVICQYITENNEIIKHIFTRRINDKYIAKSYSREKKYQLFFPKCLLCEKRQKDVQLECGHSICEDCLVKTAVKNKRVCPYCRGNFNIPNRLNKKYINKMEKEIHTLNDDLNLYKDSYESIIYRIKTCLKCIQDPECINIMKVENILKGILEDNEN